MSRGQKKYKNRLQTLLDDNDSNNLNKHGVGKTMSEKIRYCITHWLDNIIGKKKNGKNNKDLED